MRFRWGCNHPASALTWRSLLPPLLALHLLRPGSAQIRVVAPSPRVMANVGQDVVLRCHLSPCKDAWSSDIRWIQHRSSGLVHHYQDGVDQDQMEEYKGRTELLRDGLSDGNLDLRITAVTSSDSSSYTCAVQDGDGYAEAVVNLEVSDPFFQIVRSWAAALAVVLTLLLGSSVIIAFLQMKRVAQHRELKRKDAQLAEQAAILEKLAAELVKRTKEVEKKDSQLKKPCEDMEEQRKKSLEYTQRLEYWNSLLKHTLKMMGFSAADLKEQAAKLEKQTKELKNKNSQLKVQLKYMGFSAADLKKQIRKLDEHCEQMKIKDAKLEKQVAKLAEQRKESVVEMEESDKQTEESD